MRDGAVRDRASKARTDLPGSHLAFSAPIFVWHLLYICTRVSACLKRSCVTFFGAFKGGCIPSLASSRSLGSVGFPFDDTMAMGLNWSLLKSGEGCGNCCEVGKSASQKDA